MTNSARGNSAAVVAIKFAKRTYASPSLVPMTPAAAKAVLEARGNPEDPGTKEILQRIEGLLKSDGKPE